MQPEGRFPGSSVYVYLILLLICNPNLFQETLCLIIQKHIDKIHWVILQVRSGAKSQNNIV